MAKGLINSKLELGRGPGRAVLVALALSLTAGCALRQNLRNQFLSFRGAWQCEAEGCTAERMVQSRKSHRAGEVDISHVVLKPRAMMMFSAGAEPESFSAKLSCGGQSAEVPAERIKAPGSHKIGGQADAYAVIVKLDDYDFAGACTEVRVTAHATWENGKRTYDEEAGLAIE